MWAVLVGSLEELGAVHHDLEQTMLALHKEVEEYHQAQKDRQKAEARDSLSPMSDDLPCTTVCCMAFHFMCTAPLYPTSSASIPPFHCQHLVVLLAGPFSIIQAPFVPSLFSHRHVIHECGAIDQIEGTPYLTPGMA